MKNGERSYANDVVHLEEKFKGNEKYLLRLLERGRLNDEIKARIKRKTRDLEHQLLRAVNCY